ncbi:MAG: nitrogenase-stabilizing/protective protein NifW [Cyanobacteria bacterium J06592_8]
MTTATPKTYAEFKKLTDAEQYFQFFDLPYDQQFVNVNRLHILKQFSLLINQVDEAFPNLSEAEKLEKYKLALEEAYQVFVTSSPLDTKLFKVFQDAPKNVVLTQDIGTES